MRLSQLWDRKESPLPHIPWIMAIAFQAAPLEVLANLVASAGLGALLGVQLLLFRRLVDALTRGAAPAEFLTALAWLAGALVVKELASAVKPMTTQSAMEKAAVHVRVKVLEQSIALPLAAYDRADTYDFIARASSVDGRALSNGVTGIYTMLQMAIQIGSAIAVVGAASGWVAVLALLVAVPIGWAGARQGNRNLRLFRQQTPDGRMTRYLAGRLSDRPAATELRAYGLLPFLLGRWRGVFGRQQDEQAAMLARSASEGWVADLLSLLLYLAAMGLFAGQAAGGRLTAGEVVAIAGAIRLLRESATGFAQQAGAWWGQVLPAIELRTFLEMAVDRRPPEQGAPFPAPLTGPIRFEHVSFTYPGKTEPALEDVCLEIHPGERIALVGANGAGKSTLVKLLLGLYTPTSGRITVDGTELREIAPASLARQISCIFQDFERYDLTVADNVTLFRPELDRAAVEAACRQAGADGFIRELPKGYDNMLGKRFDNGSELSGGQWQRLALARAFARGAQVLVLDEPTAALDARAELELFGKFVELAEGRTAILISHRLGVARLADRVIVLDGRRVAETGHHAELMAAGGLYARLFRAQAQWYDEEAAS